MSRKWIHVVGTYNCADNSGEFVGIQPADQVIATPKLPDSQLIISIENEGGERVGSAPVEPHYGSCDDVIQEGTFQTFIELPVNASVLRLLHEGQQIAVYQAPLPNSAGSAESFGLGARTGHRLPLTHAGSTDPNTIYTLQAREKGSFIWQTLDIGLDLPDEGELDINQFPGVAAIEVRVLKSLGFETEEVNRIEIDFNE